jgi:hypothetical protein
MPIDVTCNCGKKLRIKDEYAGRKFRCPACSAINRAESPPSPDDPPPLTDWLTEELNREPIPAKAAPSEPPTAAPATMQNAAPKPKSEKKNSLIVRYTLLAIGIILLLITPYAGYRAYTNYLRGKASVNWPSVEGEITHSSVETSTGRRGRINYKAKIEYGYNVAGRIYQGSRLSFADMTGTSESSAQEVADSYPVGSKHKIYYDPEDPSCCTLRPGIGAFGGIMYAMVPIALLAVGIYLVVNSRKNPCATS